MSEHQTKPPLAAHMEAVSIRPSPRVKGSEIRWLIINCAPIEHLPFCRSHLLDESCAEVKLDWNPANVHSTFGVCWGGMAMIQPFFTGLQKHLLANKHLVFKAPQLGSKFSSSPMGSSTIFSSRQAAGQRCAALRSARHGGFEDTSRSRSGRAVLG